MSWRILALIRVVTLQQRALVPGLRLASDVVAVAVAMAVAVAIGVAILYRTLFFVFGRGLLVFIRLIKKVLSKHAKVHKERHESTGQPAEVDEHVPAVDPAGLAVLAAPITALGLKRKDGEHIGNVAQARKQKEEHAQAVGRLAAVVENQLGHPRRNVRHGAQVPKELANFVKLERVVAVLRFVLARALGTLAQKPAQHAGGADHEHNQ